MDSVGRLAELRALGCGERSLAWLDAEIEPLLTDTAAMQPADPEALTDAEIERLRAFGPELHGLCAELHAEGLPLALEHGDFWAANVIATDRGCVILDWEDATLAHPFISPDMLLASLDDAREVRHQADAGQRIRRAYLAPWLEAAPGRGWRGERLERAFDLAQRLAPLHRAVQFRLCLSLIETSWEARAFLPFFLRRLLDGRPARRG